MEYAAQQPDDTLELRIIRVRTEVSNIIRMKMIIIIMRKEHLPLSFLIGTIVHIRFPSLIQKVVFPVC